MSVHSFNLSVPFPPCPVPGNQPLPFDVDEMDFSIWLNTLATMDDIAICQQILSVLQTLNTAYPPERKLIPGRTRLFFLQKLNSVLVAATAKLTNFPGVHDISTRVDLESGKAKSEISVWSSFELANAYSLLSQENWFKEESYYSQEDKTLILANGINALSRGLLYTYQTYSKPYVFFWNKCFQFYRLAQINQLNDSDFNLGAATIDNAFKRVLLLGLSNTNQFSPQEMRTIYELLGHYSTYTGLLKSVPQKKFNGIPSINLRGNGPPVVSDDNPDKHDPDRIYIATVTVASKILEATYDRRARHLPTDRLMLLRLAKTLTLTEQRKDPRETAQGNPMGSIGFDNIIELLRGRETEQKNSGFEPQASGPVKPGELRDLNFEIVPPDHKKSEPLAKPVPELSASKNPAASFQVVEFTDPTDIWKTNKRFAHESNMKLVDKSTKGYGLLWTDIEVKPKVGGIIGIIHKKVAIGLVRWLAQSKETGMFMGVQLLGENATAVKVYNPGFPNDEVNAIYLPGGDGLNQSASLIIMNNKDFKPTEFLFLRKSHKNARYRLVKQLHLTSYINHIEVVRSY